VEIGKPPIIYLLETQQNIIFNRIFFYLKMLLIADVTNKDILTWEKSWKKYIKDENELSSKIENKFVYPKPIVEYDKM